MNLTGTAETLLKRTTSRCPICRKPAPGEVLRRSENGKDTVWLRRRCAEHGAVEACISSDARFYWLAQGDPRNGCACSAGEGGYEGTLGLNANGVQRTSPNAEPSSVCEKLSTCLALIEIVNSCNLACPTCYADSPRSSAIDAVPLTDLKRRIQGVIDRKGRIEILQLSGGEPTLHPDFFELLAWCHDNPGIDYVLLNTNGVRIATEDAFADQLGKAFRYGQFQLYLQFDGPQEEAQRTLRGADLRSLRTTAISRCAELGIPLTLAMTVTPANLPHLWESVLHGLEWLNVRGISFQPLFTSGRNPIQTPAAAGLNTADIIVNCVEQSGGILDYAAFTPLPCGDPNCATIGYLLRTPDGLKSISDFVDFTKVQAFLRDKVRYSLDDLAQCGCESEPLGRMLHEFELNETATFRLFIKPFMDAWTWDEDRIDRCCTHVIRPDGALDSFCRYYATQA
jgi:uncharacterized radical SAM superfamily Fe-S cluster-containing enzyme